MVAIVIKSLRRATPYKHTCLLPDSPVCLFVRGIAMALKAGFHLLRVWGRDILGKLSTLLENNYFIPIGNFTPGNYRIEIELEKDTRITAHLITEEFDMIVEDCYESSNRRIIIPVVVESSGIHYFRIYPRKPVWITRLFITTLKDQ